MSEYRAITITQGSGGFGGPLTVEPKEGKDVLLYITGGGAEPDILPKIVELTGCRPVNGFKDVYKRQAYHLLKFPNEKEILKQAYDEYKKLRSANRWGKKTR